MRITYQKDFKINFQMGERLHKAMYIKCTILISFFLFIVMLFTSCSKKGPNIEEIAGKANTIAVIKEKAGNYWVIPGKGIDRVDGDTVYLKINVLISMGKGEGNAETIANSLIHMRQTARGSFQATSEETTETINNEKVTTKVYDCFTGVTTKEIGLVVVEVIEIKTGEFRRSD